MPKTIKYISTILFAGLVLGSQVTMAAIVGGIEFDDNAYVDTLIGSSFNCTTDPSPVCSFFDQGNIQINSETDLADVLTDTNVATGAFSPEAGAYVQLGFTDNLLVNGEGDDLVLFELGAQDSFGVSIILGDTEVTRLANWTGYHLSSGVVTPGFGSSSDLKINAVMIDLGVDFGLSPGETVTDFLVRLDIPGGNPSDPTKPILSLAAALNSTAVPVPAAVWLFGSGLLGLVGIARRRKKAA